VKYFSTLLETNPSITNDISCHPNLSRSAVESPRMALREH